MRCRLPGPQDPAQAASWPVICASAPAAKAAVSSCRTWIQSMLPLRRMASIDGVQAVADDAVDAPDTGLDECLHESFGHGLCQHIALLQMKA